jgi:hypothetical protein
MNFSIDHILWRAEAQSGSLFTGDIRAKLQHFKSDSSENTAPFFNDAWREYTFAVEHFRWDKKGRYSFERLMVSTFMHLLLTGNQVPIQREYLSSWIIPGFVAAMLQIRAKVSVKPCCRL